jgi:hypothetical protein
MRFAKNMLSSGTSLCEDLDVHVQGFHEQAIAFPPTFKYELSSDEYNLKRTPSWTDRVLFLCNSNSDQCAFR